MKKYAGLLLVLLCLIGFCYSANNDYNEDNNESLAGKYIADWDVSSQLTLKMLFATQITDPVAKEIEISNIERLKKEAANPPGLLDKTNWLKQYITHHMIGSILFTFFILSILISFMVYIKISAQEERVQEDQDFVLQANKTSSLK